MLACCGCVRSGPRHEHLKPHADLPRQSVRWRRRAAGISVIPGRRHVYERELRKQRDCLPRLPRNFCVDGRRASVLRRPRLARAQTLSAVQAGTPAMFNSNTYGGVAITFDGLGTKLQLTVAGGALADLLMPRNATGRKRVGTDSGDSCPSRAANAVNVRGTRGILRLSNCRN
jgi:hypothetical protein